MTASAQFTLLQSAASVPATTVTALYVLPSQQSFVALLADAVVTPLATAPSQVQRVAAVRLHRVRRRRHVPIPGGQPHRRLSVGGCGGRVHSVRLWHWRFASSLDANNNRPHSSAHYCGRLRRAAARCNGGQAASSNYTLYVQLLPASGTTVAAVYGTPSVTLSGSTTLSFCPNQKLVAHLHRQQRRHRLRHRVRLGGGPAVRAHSDAQRRAYQRQRGAEHAHADHRQRGPVRCVRQRHASCSS